MNYAKNKKYFTSDGCTIFWAGVGTWFLSFFLLSFLSAMIGENIGKPEIGALLAFLSLIIIAPVVTFFIVKALLAGRVTDEKYDAMIREHIQEMEQRALDKLGIDRDEVNEIDPIIIDGYNYDQCTLYKKGKDGVWRTNVYRVIYLFFSQNEVHSYTYEFSTTEDQKKDFTDVYFYQDIVSASTESSTATFKNQKIQYESFKLTTSGGTSLNVSTRDSGHVQRSISAMRQLLRAKKVSQ